MKHKQQSNDIPTISFNDVSPANFSPTKRKQHDLRGNSTQQYQQFLTFLFTLLLGLRHLLLGIDLYFKSSLDNCDLNKQRKDQEDPENSKNINFILGIFLISTSLVFQLLKFVVASFARRTLCNKQSNIGLETTQASSSLIRTGHFNIQCDSHFQNRLYLIQILILQIALFEFSVAMMPDTYNMFWIGLFSQQLIGSQIGLFGVPILYKVGIASLNYCYHLIRFHSSHQVTFDIASFFLQLFVASIGVLDSYSCLEEVELNITKVEQQSKMKQLIHKFYQGILGLIPEGLALINANQELVLANTTIYKIFQCSKNSLVNKLMQISTFQQVSGNANNSQIINTLSQGGVLKKQDSQKAKSRRKQSHGNQDQDANSKRLPKKSVNFQEIKENIQTNQLLLQQASQASQQNLDLQKNTNESKAKVYQSLQSFNNCKNIGGVDQVNQNNEVNHQNYSSQHFKSIKSINNLDSQKSHDLINQDLEEKKNINANGMHYKQKYHNQESDIQSNYSKTSKMADCEIAQQLLNQDDDSFYTNNIIDGKLVKQKKLFLKKCRISQNIQETSIEKKEIQVSEILQLFFKKDNSTGKREVTKEEVGISATVGITTIEHQTQVPLQARQQLQENEKQKSQLGYFQIKNDSVKIEATIGGQLVVLTFILCELDIGKGSQQYVLVLVDPVWQELIRKKVEEVNNYKMKMFGSLSHELRTPLNCSISMLEFLEQEMSQTRYVSEFIQPALYSNKLLLSLINDILDFVQIGCGKFSFCFVSFDLYKMLSGTLLLISMQAKAKQLHVELQYDESVGREITSDPNRLRQILLNFLSNALKFTIRGSIIIKVTSVSIEEDDLINQQPLQNQHRQSISMANPRLVKISVIDTGIGISQKNIQRLFSAFSKIEGAKGQQKELNPQGCGLGLSISSQLAKGLGPKGANAGIIVQSEVGQGSSFSFLLEDKQNSLRQAELGGGSRQTFHYISNRMIELPDENINQQQQRQLQQQLINLPSLQMKSMNDQLDSNEEQSLSPVAQETLITSQMDNQNNQNQFITNNYLLSNEIQNHEHILVQQNTDEKCFKFPSFSEDCNEGKFLTEEEFKVMQQKQKDTSYLSARSTLKSNKKKLSLKKIFKTTTINNLSRENNNYDESFLSYNSSSNVSSTIALPEQEKKLIKLNSLSEQIQVLKHKIKTKGCLCPLVLIVDDNEFNQHVFGKMMGTYGCPFLSALSGPVALQRVKDMHQNGTCCKAFKIIFMDIQMPEMDGFQTTEAILAYFNDNKTQYRSTIIACTANIGDDDKLQVFKCGMNDFISKPIIKQGLDNLMLKWLNFE